MKKTIILVVLIISIPIWCAAKDNFTPGTITITSISSSLTANSWYYVNGSRQPQADYIGNNYIASAYQMSTVDGSDFNYAFSNSPTAYFRWKASWGPFQNYSNLPNNGIWVCTTWTASNLINFYFESK